MGSIPTDFRCSCCDEVTVDWHNIPKVIQDLMLYRQLEQSGVKNPYLFERCPTASQVQGGFDWDETEEGYDPFYELIYKGNDAPLSRLVSLDGVVDTEVIDW